MKLNLFGVEIVYNSLLFGKVCMYGNFQTRLADHVPIPDNHVWFYDLSYHKHRVLCMDAILSVNEEGSMWGYADEWDREGKDQVVYYESPEDPILGKRKGG